MPHRSSPTPASLLPALRTHLWFASCPEAFQLALVERSRLWQIKAGETLFSRGDAHDGLCCVVAGALKLGSTSPVDGSHRLTLYVEPYHWFGEISLIDRLPRSQDAVADMDSTVLVVSRAQIEPWLDEHPACWRDVARLGCGKLRLMLSAMEDNATLPVEQVLARRLLFSVTNFGQATQGAPRRHVRLPQEYLARMMGVSRQTVNKALRAMARDQVLALHYAEIEILDMGALVQRAGRIDPALVGVLLPPRPPKGGEAVA
jgi:CRP/FNR family cyclic AMP-dependent transcriptional regulator